MPRATRSIDSTIAFTISQFRTLRSDNPTNNQPTEYNMKKDNQATRDLDIEASRLVICKWWQPHDFGKWNDLKEMQNDRNHPVLLQERRCLKCNIAERRYESIT